MLREDVIRRLETTKSKLKCIGVGSLYLYGSHARNEASADSDIDVFIDPMTGVKFGFDAFMEGYEILQHTFPGQEIGYGTRKGIGPHYMPVIEAGAIKVF
jgi:uncharacterized protein